MNRQTLLFLLLLFALLPTTLSADSAPFKVGVLSGLTGAAAKWDRFQNMGITLAQEEFNAKGVPVQVIVEDSQTLSPRAISAYNKLVNLDRVDAVLADDFGFVVAPLLPLAAKQKKFLLALSLPHARYCNDGEGYFFSGTSQFSQSERAFDRFFEVHPEVKRIALITFDDPEWGESYRAIWTKLAKNRGVEIVDQFSNSEWTPDYKSILARMLRKKPQAIFLAHEPVSFLKAKAQLGYTGHIVSANNVYEALVDAPSTRPDVNGVYLVDPVISEEFRSRFVTRFGVAPILEAYAGYEALRSIVFALQRNRTNPARGMKEVSYDGVAGRIDYTGPSCAGNFARWGLYQLDGSGIPQGR